MCGILGMIGDRWAADFLRALETLARRGPDAAGLWHEGNVRLGHRRLAVLDLAGGGQPMASANGRYHLVFNGEIYNFRQLRQELMTAGCHFATQSDTEVLLQAYATWGEAMLNKLDGMFAFAIWDRQRCHLFAARDPIGIKPLFYSTVEGFVFASTLTPFWQLTGFPRHLNYQALRDYLACQSIFAPMSLLSDVHVLPPACWLRWEAATHRLHTGRYWDIPAPTAIPMALEELVDVTDAALCESVKRQLIADVPVGAFLSGGIDSSLLVHYMATMTGPKVPTFSVRFPSQRYDESPYARAVATRYDCEHHIFEAQELTPERLLQAIQALDQPLADPAYLPTLLLAAMCRQHVTVALSGDGGDEMFCGYERFLWQEHDFPDTPWHYLLRRAVRAGYLPGSLWRRTLRGRDWLLWKRVQLGPYPTSRKSMQRFLTPEAWTACQPHKTLETWLHHVLRFHQTMDTDSLRRGDIWTYLSDNCLVKTDRASMSQSLEVRLPMLGRPILDTVLPQPTWLHTVEGTKTILKRLAARYLPRQVWERPKHGFSVPLSNYLRHSWRDLCTTYVNATPTLAPFLRPEAVQHCWRHTQHGRGSPRLMYTLVVLLAWLETHPIDS